MTAPRDDDAQPDALGTLFPATGPHDPERPPARLRPTRRAWIVIGVVAAFVVAAVITGIVVAVANSAGAPSKIEAAVTYCGLEGNPYAAVAEDGRSVSLDTTGDTTVEGLDAADLVCVLVEVDASDEALEAMSSTAPDDGPQSAEWSGIAATWQHRPDAGLDVTLTEK